MFNFFTDSLNSAEVETIKKNEEKIKENEIENKLKELNSQPIWKKIIVYKGVTKKLTALCSPFQYEINKTYYLNNNNQLELGKNGFHAYRNLWTLLYNCPIESNHYRYFKAELEVPAQWVYKNNCYQLETPSLYDTNSQIRLSNAYKANVYLGKSVTLLSEITYDELEPYINNSFKFLIPAEKYPLFCESNETLSSIFIKRWHTELAKRGFNKIFIAASLDNIKDITKDLDKQIKVLNSLCGIADEGVSKDMQVYLFYTQLLKGLN